MTSGRASEAVERLAQHSEAIGSPGRDSSPLHTSHPLPTPRHDSAHRPGGTQAAGWLATRCQTTADVSCLHPSWLLWMQNGLRRIQTGASQRSAAPSHVSHQEDSHQQPAPFDVTCFLHNLAGFAVVTSQSTASLKRNLIHNTFPSINI